MLVGGTFLSRNPGILVAPSLLYTVANATNGQI